jgi:hypothetical protein
MIRASAAPISSIHLNVAGASNDTSRGSTDCEPGRVPGKSVCPGRGAGCAEAGEDGKTPAALSKFAGGGEDGGGDTGGRFTAGDGAADGGGTTRIGVASSCEKGNGTSPCKVVPHRLQSVSSGSTLFPQVGHSREGHGSPVFGVSAIKASLSLLWGNTFSYCVPH